MRGCSRIWRRRSRRSVAIRARWRRRSPSRRRLSRCRPQSLKVQQPFLVDLATLGRKLTPATAELRAALPNINPAIEVGTRTLARTPSLNANLQQVMGALKSLAQAPGTNVAINALTSTVSTLNPMVRYLGPYQTVCDDWNYFWTYLSEHISEQTSFGYAQRALLNFGNPTAAQQRRPAGRDAAGQRRRYGLAAERRQRVPARPALRRGDRQRRATPTARPASAATPRSSTTSTRSTATSPPTRTLRATRARRSRAAPASPRARRSAATPPPARSSPPTRATHEPVQTQAQAHARA